MGRIVSNFTSWTPHIPTADEGHILALKPSPQNGPIGLCNVHYLPACSSPAGDNLTNLSIARLAGLVPHLRLHPIRRSAHGRHVNLSLKSALKSHFSSSLT